MSEEEQIGPGAMMRAGIVDPSEWAKRFRRALRNCGADGLDCEAWFRSAMRASAYHGNLGKIGSVQQAAPQAAPQVSGAIRGAQTARPVDLAALDKNVGPLAALMEGMEKVDAIMTARHKVSFVLKYLLGLGRSISPEDAKNAAAVYDEVVKASGVAEAERDFKKAVG